MPLPIRFRPYEQLPPRQRPYCWGDLVRALLWAVAFALVVMPLVEWRREYWDEIFSTWQTKLVTSLILSGGAFVVLLLSAALLGLPGRGRLTGFDVFFGVVAACLAGGPLAYVLGVLTGVRGLWAAAAVLGPFVFGALATSAFELALTEEPFSLRSSLRSSLAFAGAVVVVGFVPGAAGAGLVFTFETPLEERWPGLVSYLSLSAYCLGMLGAGAVVARRLTRGSGGSGDPT